ncbi:probable WRKY transcription factor 65 [Tanacetum coccineum]|uniref:Probable WRKY transcription factor 65 n=1 Tax=Tanacetum coccineum TaxID=301880 RepID=A0ABQ4WZN4_9ASTR
MTVGTNNIHVPSEMSPPSLICSVPIPFPSNEMNIPLLPLPTFTAALTHLHQICVNYANDACVAKLFQGCPKLEEIMVQQSWDSDMPITEIDGSRLKSETNALPTDSWACRKRGQKPIKGSPYPRCMELVKPFPGWGPFDLREQNISRSAKPLDFF